jgi:hypothetical protein
MEKSKVGFGIGSVIAALVMSIGVPAVFAGNQGAYMNSAGYGKAASNVRYNGVLSSVLSPAQYFPCAAVNPLGTFACVNVAGEAPGGGAGFCLLPGEGRAELPVEDPVVCDRWGDGGQHGH